MDRNLSITIIDVTFCIEPVEVNFISWDVRWDDGKVKLFGAKLAHTAGAYTGFRSMKPTRSIATTPLICGMLVQRQVTPPPQNFVRLP